jgi:hypothetical protein
LSNEELNSLLIHAHKRVLQLQKQIEKMQVSRTVYTLSTIETKNCLYTLINPPIKVNQNKLIEAALDDQRRQNLELQKQAEANLNELNRKEFNLEKDKLVDFYF